MHTRALALLLALLTFGAFGCKELREPAASHEGNGKKKVVSNFEVAATVPTPFKPLYRGPGIQRSNISAVWADLPYDSISLERTECYGPCPVYRVTLHRNGRAELHAEESFQG